MILPLDLIETVSPDAVVLFREGRNEKETRGSDQTHSEIHPEAMEKVRSVMDIRSSRN